MFGGMASRAFWGDEVPGAHEVPSPPPTPSHPHSCFYRGNCTLTTSQPLGSDRAASPVSAAPPAGPGAHPRDPQGSRPGSGAGSHSEVPAGGSCRFILLKPFFTPWWQGADRGLQETCWVAGSPVVPGRAARLGGGRPCTPQPPPVPQSSALGVQSTPATATPPYRLDQSQAPPFLRPG